jgi:hypothetical protein
VCDRPATHIPSGTATVIERLSAHRPMNGTRPAGRMVA